MRIQRASSRAGLLVVCTVVGFLGVHAGLAATPPVGQAEGTIAAVDPGSITLTTSAGTQARVTITGETSIIQRKVVTLENIKPNDFVGVTARREADGSLTAISINIFPPEFKGRMRPVQFVMDTGNTMTNATVMQNVRRIEGRTLYLKLADGTAVIAVPKDAGVFRFTVIKPSDLKPGMHALARGTTSTDGSLTATTITVDSR